jgi:hypothetical protein
MIHARFGDNENPRVQDGFFPVKMVSQGMFRKTATPPPMIQLAPMLIPSRVTVLLPTKVFSATAVPPLMIAAVEI